MSKALYLVVDLMIFFQNFFSFSSFILRSSLIGHQTLINGLQITLADFYYFIHRVCRVEHSLKFIVRGDVSFMELIVDFEQSSLLVHSWITIDPWDF